MEGSRAALIVQRAVAVREKLHEWYMGKRFGVISTEYVYW
jgi:hypothetical protein